MEDQQVRVLDKTFALSVSESQITEAIAKIAQQMNEELYDKNPLFIVLLNGAFMFASDLLKKLNFPSQVSFVKYASYEGTDSTGEVRELMGLSENVEGRTVVIIEDIVDTGLTMASFLSALKGLQPKDIRIVALFLKPEKLQVDLQVDYVAFSIPNDFIVGYGLDYNGYGRNLPAVYSLMG